MSYLINNLHEKSITDSSDRHNFDSANLFLICIHVTTLCYMTNTVISNQSEAYDLSIYSIILINFTNS